MNVPRFRRPFVTLMPHVPILLALTPVLASQDTLETEKHAEVTKNISCSLSAVLNLGSKGATTDNPKSQILLYGNQVQRTHFMLAIYFKHLAPKFILPRISIILIGVTIDKEIDHALRNIIVCARSSCFMNEKYIYINVPPSFCLAPQTGEILRIH